MKANLVYILMLALVPVSCSGKEYAVISPDGSLKIEIGTDQNRLLYKVTKNDHVIISTSEMKWSAGGTTLGDRVEKMTVLGKTTENTRYQITGSIHSIAENHCNAARYRISLSEGGDFLLEVKAFDEGIAFRYIAESTGESSVEDFTTFVLPEQTAVWMQEDFNFYEGVYVRKNAEDLAMEAMAGPPVVVEYPSLGLYSAITEANLYDFAGMGLQVSGKYTLRAKLSGETLKSGRIETPWRVILAGDLNMLVNNDVITNLSEPPSTELFQNAPEWIKPGICVWNWLTDYIVSSGYRVAFEDMKIFSKLAGELGIEYNLVDEGWSHWQEGEKDCWELMKELVDYSAEQGVRIWAWKAYPDRKGIPGLQTAEKRREFFKKCSEIGIAGLKIDFFDSEGQDITKFYGDALRDAAEYRLMINFHGSNKPTGLTRTFPNELARESIRGYEAGVRVESDVTLPFTRLIAGHADYTPLFLNESKMGGTSWPHQIAGALVFCCPLLCVAADPGEILENPHRELICTLPTVWDQTVVLPPSEIGELVLLAKRKGDEWYIAGMTKDQRSGLAVDLGFLGQGNYTAHIVEDDPATQIGSVTKDIQVSAGQKLPVNMNSKGGFVAKIIPAP